jgi:putative YpdA family bacillithiol system oxidoreductase
MRAPDDARVRDVLVIGAGPVGLACALEAERQGLSSVVVEKGALLETIRRYPTYTTFFSTAELLEIGGFPFTSAGAKPTRKEALIYYRRVAERAALDVRLYTRVTAVRRGAEDVFDVETTRGTHRARNVVAAIGFFDTPNLLGVAGEDLPKVTHYYREAFAYAGSDVLVVGGKNSAVEAALDMHRNGARVTMAVRGETFGKSVKYWLLPDIENRVKEGAVRAFFGSRVLSIGERSVVLATKNGEREIENDFVVALTGYRPDFGFLRSIGVPVTEDGRLDFDAGTMETPTRGLFIAGVIAGGIQIGKLFIENGRIHAVTIARTLAERAGKTPVPAPVPLSVRRFQDGD